MHPESTALVLVEYQNDFVSEGGALHNAVAGVIYQTDMLANTVAAVSEARALGVTIVHAPIAFTEDYRELGRQPAGILKGVVASRAFRKGTWGAQIVEALTPEPSDLILEGKRGLCAFATTDLDFVLRSRGVTTIAVSGLLTNRCVESTVRNGFEKGYSVTALKDCMATVSAEQQQMAVENTLPMFARVLTRNEWLADLRSASL